MRPPRSSKAGASVHKADGCAEPPRDCGLCERLVAFRTENRRSEPGWFNGAVPSFGTERARLLIVGLAPGLGGANRTGRPFTGDFAGGLLYRTLLEFGFALGRYEARPDDGLVLVDCMISNAVRCVPPANKPTPAEIARCRPHLAARIAALARIEVMLALGRIAHDQVLSALDLRKSQFPFAHGACHALGGGLTLFDSFHCSRYNSNTGRLTPEMFQSVFAAVRAHLDDNGRD
ncbi:MAG: uracil-DNA glycosylase [Hyphomicrobium sp.]